jgi:hypothetical protein
MTLNAEVKPASQPLGEDESAPLSYCLIVFLVSFVFVAAPAFFHQFFVTSEEQVSIFGGAYGLRLFYPGSNRIMMVVPLITSWLGTPARIMAAHFFFNVISVSAALAVFTHALPRRLFFPVCLSLLVFVTVFFGGGMYQFHLSVVQPYLASTSLGLIVTTIVLTSSRSGVIYVLQLLGLFIITVAAAGINPSVSMLFAVFFALKLLVALFVPRAPFCVHSLWGYVTRVVRPNVNLIVGLGLNLAAISVVFFCYKWYKKIFPQYVQSNYSVDSYLGSGLSFTELENSLGYIVDFHYNASLLEPFAARWIVGAIIVSGLGSFALWGYRRTRSPQLAKYYLLAFLLWLSALTVIVVLSQNSHIQLVSNFIRGRYFTSAYYVMVVALCLTVGTAAADVIGNGPNWRYSKMSMLAVAIAAVGGNYLVHFTRWGSPSFEIVERNSGIEAVAARVREAQVPVVLGNYWWIWDIQYELNRSIPGAPVITPVTIRTEAFGLNVFKPITAALASSKNFRFVCVELKEPPPELEEACSPQIAFYRAQGGFPFGEIRELSRSEVSIYKLTLYELGLANPADPADCTASQVLFRAKPVSSAVPGQDSYMLDEDSFVYLQRPEARADWVIRFTQRGREEVVIVPSVGQSYFHLLDHRIATTGEGCRMLVTVSRRDNLVPRTMKMDVR